MPTVEIFRPEKGEPRILVQRRPDEQTFACTVQEAHKLMDEEMIGPCKGPACLACKLHDALEGIR